MRIDPKTDMVTLDAPERRALQYAASICRHVMPHVSGETRENADNAAACLGAVEKAMAPEPKKPA